MRTKFASLIVAGCLILTLFAAFLFLPTPFKCELPRANAQDNPCLAQEATLSALQLELFKSQSTQQAMQATLTAYETTNDLRIGAVADTFTNSVSFTDSFDGNTRGWELPGNEHGAARISRGQLTLSADGGHSTFVPIPGLTGHNFYIEAAVSVDTGGSWYPSVFFGYFVGDRAADRYHYVGFDMQTPFSTYYYASLFDVEDNANQLFRAEYDNPFRDGAPVVGLEALNGNYTFYINGSPMETFQFEAYGQDAGFVVWGRNDSSASIAVSFDNVSVRERR